LSPAGRSAGCGFSKCSDRPGNANAVSGSKVAPPSAQDTSAQDTSDQDTSAQDTSAQDSVFLKVRFNFPIPAQKFGISAFLKAQLSLFKLGLFKLGLFKLSLFKLGLFKTSPNAKLKSSVQKLSPKTQPKSPGLTVRSRRFSSLAWVSQIERIRAVSIRAVSIRATQIRAVRKKERSNTPLGKISWVRERWQLAHDTVFDRRKPLQ
jgi:hypothetical protein